jgi:hypothetical protein
MGLHCTGSCRRQPASKPGQPIEGPTRLGYADFDWAYMVRQLARFA